MKIFICLLIFIARVVYSQDKIEPDTIKHVILKTVILDTLGSSEQIHKYIDDNLPSGKDPGKFCKETTTTVIVTVNKHNKGEMEIFLAYKDKNRENASCPLYIFEPGMTGLMVIEVKTPGIGEVYIRNKMNTPVKISYKAICPP